MAAYMRCVDPSLTAPFGMGKLEQRGSERNAARSGTGMYRSWRGKETIKNRIEMKTKKRTRWWPSRDRYIHGRVIMVATAGEWVPWEGEDERERVKTKPNTHRRKTHLGKARKKEAHTGVVPNETHHREC
ncbi:hypothetical protein F5148DRAFT_1371043 [Russula earlei]|uniref:Uncharacterized protein n=1 Tax=Russula earlei TaxID=71964 RepID=A0ACC0TUC3_9AGAM|nr:hypothetical protein F5148DRAFT_1371043 [Russula earlei]